ncbi:hypothetical protein RclHR1_01310013 [Rhizophagus clarus]|nr:hypothetical protein RclHR1_01310013 [Rhizophagus clarus]
MNNKYSDNDYISCIPHEQYVRDSQQYGLCTECKKPNTWINWCMECYSKKFRQNFCNWTSGNEHIDKFIQESQLNANCDYELLEWIPYDRLSDITFLAKGGFGVIYEAIWLDGRIINWDTEKQDWKRKDTNIYQNENLKSNRKNGFWVILKSLNNSLNINEDFLNEWKLHLRCQRRAWSNYTSLIPLLGITQDPDTKNYMVVMINAFDGSLRNNLLIKKYNPNDKFRNLWDISRQLKAIHSLNLVHGDFHNGNLLYFTDNVLMISDLGLCRLVNNPNKNNEIYGVLPYIAPEVLRGKPYTKAADIYSFGIIMWEMTSGVPAFCDIPHDFNLCLNICMGDRPKIIEGTMPEYVELMKRCWDNDPKKRPTADELSEIFDEWDKKYPMEKDEEKRIPVPDNAPEIKYHLKAYYTSKRFTRSVELNKILSSEKIVILNDNNEDELNECMIEI